MKAVALLLLLCATLGGAIAQHADVPDFAEPAADFRTARPGEARGRVDEFSYHSAITGGRRKASVYLPAGYSKDRRYPVLYLLHGIAGNHDEWRGYVQADIILDNLIRDGRAVPMIAVMPNGRALPDDRPPPPGRVFSAEHIAGFANFERDLLEALVPAIDAAYPTVPDRTHRALAGLSMGGGQALNFGIGHPRTFAWVAGFSSAPNTRPPAELLADAAAVRSLQLLYLSCGRKDGLLHVSESLHAALKQHGIAHAWHVDDHGHDRESWARNLFHFAQRIFRRN